MEDTPCPCQSGSSYKTCCKPFHEGKTPPTAKQLMRSRYSAYAKGLADYIIQTTHEKNPLYKENKTFWKKDILNFSQNTCYDNLTILEHQEKDDLATVYFFAELSTKNEPKQDLSFHELSHFKKEKDKWLYLKGELS